MSCSLSTDYVQRLPILPQTSNSFEDFVAKFREGQANAFIVVQCIPKEKTTALSSDNSSNHLSSFRIKREAHLMSSYAAIGFGIIARVTAFAFNVDNIIEEASRHLSVKEPRFLLLRHQGEVCCVVCSPVLIL